MTEMQNGICFSIALCTFNGERYLTEQLESLAQQSLLPSELVVGDDVSRDDTLRILQAFAKHAPFPVRIYRNDHTLGVTQNFSITLSKCNSEYIALCDQDDVWLPHKLQRFARLFAANRRCEAAFSDALLVDESLRSTRKRLWSRVGLSRRVYRQIRRGQVLAFLAERNLVTGATLVISRSCRDKAVPIPENLPAEVIHDGWIALVAATENKLCLVDEPLVLYRQHAQQQIGAKNVPLGLRRYTRWVKISIEERQKRANRHRNDTRQLALRNSRLAELFRQKGLGTAESSRVWTDAMKHTAKRASLTSRLGPRILAIAQSVICRDYARFSTRPWVTISRDLLYPAQSESLEHEG